MDTQETGTGKRFAHHQLIKSMVVEIRKLRRQAEQDRNALEELEWSAYRAQERASAASREAQTAAEEARRAQDDANYRESRRQDALRDLERAREWGNEWEADRAMNKLKEWS